MATQIPAEQDPRLEPIWEGDLFERKQEAADLVAFIESIGGRPSLREDKRAYTIAIDAPYGVGKTFFLKRLSEHLALDRPVAFVDAWADDLVDEPLTALAATLQEALKPLMGEPKIKGRVSDLMSKAGKVAKVGGTGLLKRGLGFAMGHQTVDLIGTILSGVDEDARKEIEKKIAEASDEIIEEASDAIAEVTGHSLMEKRVAEFREGKEAVEAMKASLEGIVEALSETDKCSPIVIVIDELDRCRPTYAIKLLEEIKHLFDVPGLVFVLATHTTQLSHSISAAYGSKFDGRAYLRRFIDRDYKLQEPDLGKLIAFLCDQHGISEQKFQFPKVYDESNELRPAMAGLIAEYFRVYELVARDAFHFIDILQTAAALSQDNALIAPYIFPLAIGQIKGLSYGELPSPKRKSRWRFVSFKNYAPQETEEYSFEEYAGSVKAVTELTTRELYQQANDDAAPFIVNMAMNQHSSMDGAQPIWTIYRYPELLQRVNRFKNP